MQAAFFRFIFMLKKLPYENAGDFYFNFSFNFGLR